MGMNTGPENSRFDFSENESGVSELRRLELMKDIVMRRENIARETMSTTINTDPLLRALLAKIIETGPELESTHLAHLRRIAALRLHTIPDIIEQAATDTVFFRLAIETVYDEIQDLEFALQQTRDDMPDKWDTALKDLTRLEGNDDSDS